jgi:hypothetical protein
VTCKRSSRTVLWLLLAAALFMRAFLPQGYMPERTASGAITVKVCGSGHVLQIPTGKDKAPDDSDRAEPPCAFAGLGTPALPPPLVAELPAPEPLERAFARSGHAAPLVVAPLPHPPARGPPLAA